MFCTSQICGKQQTLQYDKLLPNSWIRKQNGRFSVLYFLNYPPCSDKRKIKEYCFLGMACLEWCTCAKLFNVGIVSYCTGFKNGLKHHHPKLSGCVCFCHVQICFQIHILSQILLDSIYIRLSVSRYIWKVDDPMDILAYIIDQSHSFQKSVYKCMHTLKNVQKCKK